MLLHFSGVLGRFLRWERNPELLHFGKLELHPSPSNVLGAKEAANQAAREDSENPVNSAY